MLITFSLKNHIFPFFLYQNLFFYNFIDNFIYNGLIYPEQSWTMKKHYLMIYREYFWLFFLELCDIFDCIIFHFMNFQLVFRSLIPSFRIIFEELSTFALSFVIKSKNLFIICILICYQFYLVYKKNWIRKCKVITAKVEVRIPPSSIKLSWV